jgi:GNAT superfamily N-acetyltransferase
MAGVGYICPTCSHYSAVCYGRSNVDPLVALQPNWNPDLLRRGEQVEENLYLARCRTKKDFLQTRLLQILAKQEDDRLLFARDKEQCTGIYFNRATAKFIGYVIWTEHKDYAALRQLFILPDERRKKHGEKLVTFWVSRYADPIGPKFGVEAPNDKALHLHVKLGHVERIGDTLSGKKCFFLSSM